MNAAVGALLKREILRFARQRSRWIGALGTPLMFWLFIGGGLGSSFRMPGLETGPTSYLGYFFPGAIFLSVLFTAIFSTISVIEDRHEGFLQGVLTSPTPPMALVLAKMLGGALLGLAQAGLMLAIAPLLGLELSILRVLAAFVLLFVSGFWLTGLGFYFAWKLDSVQGFHGVMNTVLVPLWLLSGAVFPSGGSAVPLQWATRLNPLSYEVAGLQALLWEESFPWTAWGMALSLGVGLSILLVLVGERMTSRR